MRLHPSLQAPALPMHLPPAASLPPALPTCSASSSTLPPAASAVTANLSGCSATMSSVWVPMEPVEPSSENFCLQAARRKADDVGKVVG